MTPVDPNAAISDRVEKFFLANIKTGPREKFCFLDFPEPAPDVLMKDAAGQQAYSAAKAAETTSLILDTIYSHDLPKQRCHAHVSRLWSETYREGLVVPAGARQDATLQAAPALAAAKSKVSDDRKLASVLQLSEQYFPCPVRPADWAAPGQSAWIAVSLEIRFGNRVPLAHLVIKPAAALRDPAALEGIEAPIVRRTMAAGWLAHRRKPVVVVKPPPISKPPVQRPPRPSAGFVWVEGRWELQGDKHVWIPPHWERERARPEPGVTWISIDLEYLLVRAEPRPWLHRPLLDRDDWFVPGKRRGADTQPGELGLYAETMGFVAVRNVVIKGDWTGDDLRQVSGENAYIGPLAIAGDTNRGDKVIESPRIQIIGVLYEPMPALPPMDDPALLPPAP